MIPSEKEALALHSKYGSGERIVRHCQTVARVAGILAEGLEKSGVKIDTKTVVAAALLHDIGRSRFQTVRHGVEGAEMIEREDVDRRVVEIVRKHVGAGISPEEAERLGLPRLDYIPSTIEERVVCFADKMVDSDRVRPFELEVSRFVARKHDVQRLLELRKRLRVELGTDPNEFVLDKIKESGYEAAARCQRASAGSAGTRPTRAAPNALAAPTSGPHACRSRPRKSSAPNRGHPEAYNSRQ